MVYQWRPRQIADVRSLQSQLHNVNGRSASGDLIILPLSSMPEVFGIKTTFGEMLRNGTPFQQILKGVEKELRAQAPRHTCRHHPESIVPGAESFFKATSSSNSVRSMANGYRQELSEHTARYFRTGDASGPRCGLKNGPPVLAKPSS